jgi:uncharacterized membrane protein YphA (DoxX/SURF4 family)
LLSATVLLLCVVAHLRNSSHFASIVPYLIAAGAGMLLLVGLWTPVAGVVTAVCELWIIFSGSGHHPSMSIALATFGATLAMIGPGAWSIDARLFGRKHFEIPER